MSKKSKISTSKSKLVLLKSPKVGVEVPVLKASVVKPPVSKSIPPVVTSSIVPKADPLSAVAGIPEKIAAENLAILPTPVKPDPVKASATLPKLEPLGTSPWDRPAKLLEMAHDNTKFVSTFVGRFVAARSPQDLLTIGSEFSKEGGLLFSQQSNTFLKMLSW